MSKLKAVGRIDERGNYSGDTTDAPFLVYRSEPDAPDAPSAEPVAWLFQHDDTGLTECVDAQQVEWGFEKNNPRWKKIHPLYALPPDAAAEIARLRDLLDEQKGTIRALNMALAGEGSTSTENLIAAHELDPGCAGLISLCMELRAEVERLTRLRDAQIATVWRAAMTGACNVVISRQNRLNDDDGPCDIIVEQGEIIRGIKGWLEIDEVFLNEVRTMVSATRCDCEWYPGIAHDFETAKATVAQQAERIAELESLLAVEKGQFTIRDEACGVLFARVDAQSAALAKARTLIGEAADDIESWVAYASEYFREKHNLSGGVARYRAAAVALGRPASDADNATYLGIARNYGWIDWRGAPGGKRPVEDDQTIEVELVCGEKHVDRAGKFDFRWFGNYEPADIVRYRIIADEEEKEPRHD